MRRLRTHIRHVESTGFYDGSQGLDASLGQKRLEVLFDQAKAAAEMKVVKRIKKLEAKGQIRDRHKDEASGRWETCRTRFGVLPPQLILPLLGILASLIVVAGEAVFLAPVMDGFGIADPSAQILLALVIVVAASGLVKIAYSGIVRSSPVARAGEGKLGQVMRICIAGLTLALLGSLGWWRSSELIYAESAHLDLLNRFLAANVYGTRAIVVLLTISLPIVAASLFFWGMTRIRTSVTWRKARRDYLRRSNRLDRTAKAWETQQEILKQKLATLEKQKAEWISVYSRGYQLGQAIGARQIPLGFFILRTAGFALLVFVLAFFLLPLFLRPGLSMGMLILLSAVSALGLGSLFLVGQLEAWSRPSPRQLDRQRAVLWTAPSTGPSTLSQQIGALPAAALGNPNGKYHGTTRHELDTSLDKDARSTAMNARLIGWSVFAATSVFLLNSCTVSGDRQRNATVVVIDLTRSVERPALESAVELVEQAVQKVERGDRVTVIPINADAGAQSQGAVLRYIAAEKREPYDGDLHRLQTQARKDIEALAADATHARSDILGAVALAAEELSTAGGFRKDPGRPDRLYPG